MDEASVGSAGLASSYSVQSASSAAGAAFVALRPKALELRKRVAERRDADARALRRAADLLAHEQRRSAERFEADARTQSGKDTMRNVLALDAERRLHERADQQLEIQSAIAQLGRDLSRAVGDDRATRTKLGDLERRIRKVQSKARSESEPFADNEVDTAKNEAHDDRKVLGKGPRLADLFATCRRCSQRVVRQQLEGHKRVCIGKPVEDDDVRGMLAESGQPSAACRICLALLRPDCVSAHEAKCREKARTSNDAKNASSSPTGVGNVAFPPQPPRHFAVSSVGPMSISLEWAPPILDGGSTVVEYEVSLSYVKILGKVGKQIQLEIVHLPPVLTTAFADRHPVSDFGHVLTGLEGGVEYRGLSVRCQNAVGWSPASDVVESVWTAAAVPPSAPQCLRHLPPTRTTVALHWAPPFYDGGAVVCDYVVSYTELRRLTPNEWVSEKNAFSRQQLAAGERLVNGKHELRTAVTLNVGGPATRKVLRGLRGGTDYEHVAIAALSVKRLLSPFCRLGGVITTLPPSARALLETELARAAAVRGDFLDTDFYQGFLQREAKADYVSRLESDLQQTIEAELRESLATPPADGVEQEEADELLEEAAVLSAAESVKASAYVPTADEDDEAEACALVPGYLLQRGQFEHRLEALRVGILDAEKVQTASFVERAALTKSMADCQLRLLAIQAEVDRVSGLRAQYINSSVMHGSVQRFTKPQLQKDLQLELEKCFGKIADAKRQARALDETRTGAVKAAKRKLDELQERRAALQGIKAAAKRQAALQKVAQKSMGSAVTDLARLLRESFGVWAAYRGARKRARRLAKRMFGGVVLRYCRGAWHRWRFGSDPFEADDGDISKGGRLLGLAARRRTEALDEAREALLDLQQVRQSCDALAYNRQQMQNWKAKNKAGFEVAELSMPAGIPFAREDPQGDGDSNAAEHSVSKVPASTAHLLQGDGLYRMGRADDAVKCYAAAVDALWQRPRLEAERRRSQGESAFESGPVDVVELARLYSRTGAAQAAALHHAESVVSYDRALRLSKELEEALSRLARNVPGDMVDDAQLCVEKFDGDTQKADAACQTQKGDALLGLGKALLETCRYAEAHVSLERAKELFGSLTDVGKQAAVLRALADCAKREFADDGAARRHTDAADEVSDALRLKMRRADVRLEEMKAKMLDSSANQGAVIRLARESARTLRLRAERAATEERIAQLAEERVDQEKETKKVVDLLARIAEQLIEAKKTDKDEMASALVHGREQIFEVEELKVRLAERAVEVDAEIVKSVSAERAIDIQILNCRDDMQEAQLELDVETGALMRSVLAKAPLRFVALNVSNLAGNEVLGAASGGVSMVAAAAGRTISVYDLATGSLRRIFSGDEEGRHLGDVVGHTALVSCLYFAGECIFSGGKDARTFAWDVSEKALAARNLIGAKFKSNSNLDGEAPTDLEKLGAAGLPVLRFVEGHESTVSAVACDALKVVTGGADCKTILWSRSTGDKLRVLHGHRRTVSCLHVGPNWVVTGGAESTVRVWALPKEADPSHALLHDTARDGALEALRKLPIISRTPLEAGGPALTAVKYGALEVLGGLADGSVVVWWLATGAVTQRTHAHRGPVLDVQFDATRIVSAGEDSLVVVTDVTSGLILQSLRGHAGRVACVQFDTGRILSAGVDSTLRQWPWAAGAKKGPRDKFHVFDAGDSLANVSRKYNVALKDVLRWNAVEDVRSVVAGTRLVVAKAFADEPTAAEKALALNHEKKRRRNEEQTNSALLRGARAGNDAAPAKSVVPEAKALMKLLDKRHVDLSSTASRFAKGVAPANVDTDVVLARRRGRVVEDAVRARDGLASRLAGSIQEAIDPFGEEADRRKAVGVAAARRLEDRDKVGFEARSARDAEVNALYVRDALILPAVIEVLLYELAEEATQKATWQQSLAGRLHDTIGDGPLDYGALESMVRQQRFDAARLSVSKHQIHSLADASMAATGLLARDDALDDARKKLTRDDAQSDADADSQFDVETLVSGSSDGGTVARAARDAFFKRVRRSKR